MVPFTALLASKAGSVQIPNNLKCKTTHMPPGPSCRDCFPISVSVHMIAQTCPVRLMHYYCHQPAPVPLRGHRRIYPSTILPSICLFIHVSSHSPIHYLPIHASIHPPIHTYIHHTFIFAIYHLSIYYHLTHPPTHSSIHHPQSIHTRSSTRPSPIHYLSIHPPSIHVSIHLPTHHPSIIHHLFIHHPSIHASTHTFIIHASIYPFTHTPSIHLLIQPSIYHSSIHTSIYSTSIHPPCIHLSITHPYTNPPIHLPMNSCIRPSIFSTINTLLTLLVRPQQKGYLLPTSAQVHLTSILSPPHKFKGNFQWQQDNV